MDLQKLADSLRAQTGLTAVGVGVSRMGVGGEDTMLAVAGVRRHRCLVPVEVGDQWHMGSIGKSLTATMIASLFAKDFPQLDAPLVDLLPEEEIDPWWHGCTLYHLLTSTSGLQRDFPLRRLFGKVEQDPSKVPAERRKLVAEVLAKPGKHKSGERFHYSNLGYSILGLIAEQTTGSDYASLIREHVFAPLQLTSGGFGAPKGADEDAQPMGHRRLLGYRKILNPFKGAADLPPFMAPAGRVHMNLADLLRYGQAHLRHRGALAALFPEETFMLLHTPYLDEYACGWVVQRNGFAGDAEIIWHNGSNGGWYALLMLVPDTQTVLALVTNDGVIKQASSAFDVAAKEIYLSL